MLDYSPACIHQHMGLWAIDQAYAERLLSVLQSGFLANTELPLRPVRARSESGYDLFDTTALIPLVGHLTRGGDSFGGGSTVNARKAIRTASRDEAVQQITLYIDSPGGTVAGTHELAAEFREAGNRVATHAHIQDMGTSAAYYIASQAQRITANPTALIGNIGVKTRIIDTSQAFTMQGVKVHIISTGPFKSIGDAGQEVTPEQLDHIQTIIDQTFEFFVDAIGVRNLSDEQLEEVLSGKLYLSADALRLGLIDEISDFEASIQLPTSEELEDMDEQSLAQAIVASLVRAGIVEAKAAESDKTEAKPDEGAGGQPGQPAYEVGFAKAPIVERIDASISGGAITDEYKMGVEAGKESVQRDAVGILEMCAMLNLGVETGLSAIRDGRTVAQFQSEMYEQRSSASGEELRHTPPAAKSSTPPVISSGEIYARRMQRTAGATQ